MKKLLREHLKKIYKKKKYDDGVWIGRDINETMQKLHQQHKLLKKDRSAEIITECFETLKALRGERRFRQDFPTFCSFRKYVRKEKLSLKDLKEL